MPATGIFFIPATPSAGADTLSPYQRIFNNLLLDHHLEPLTHWTLEHRLFRETAAISAGESVPTTPTAGAGVLQILTLSHHSGTSYAAIGRVSSASRAIAAAGAGTAAGNAAAPARPGAPGAATSKGAAAAPPPQPIVPSTDTPLVMLPSGGTAGSGADELTALLTARFAPLWTRRGTLHVAQGPAYRAGASIVVRFGELREARGPQGQQGQQQQPPGGAQGVTGIARGTVVEVRYVSKTTAMATAKTNGQDKDVAMVDGEADGEGKEKEKEDEETAEVRKFWASLNVTGAREFVARHEKDDTMPVRLWLEALKPR